MCIKGGPAEKFRLYLRLMNRRVNSKPERRLTRRLEQTLTHQFNRVAQLGDTEQIRGAEKRRAGERDCDRQIDDPFPLRHACDGRKKEALCHETDRAKN